jgi:hypothetical protein
MCAHTERRRANTWSMNPNLNQHMFFRLQAVNGKPRLIVAGAGRQSAEDGLTGRVRSRFYPAPAIVAGYVGFLESMVGRCAASSQV